MSLPFELETVHIRLLWLIYQHPNGITARGLVNELKIRGWCEPWVTPADLGYEPEDVVSRPRAPASQP